jgi:anti-sigma factor ChrR (cupin superfamily)
MAIVGVRSLEAGIESAEAIMLRRFFQTKRDGNSLLLAKCESGFVAPYHSHNIDEFIYIVDGALTWNDGQTFVAGDAVVQEANTRYSFKAGPNGATFIAFAAGEMQTIHYDAPDRVEPSPAARKPGI